MGRRPAPSPQPRALQALELSLTISGSEHNVYLAGEPGLGRTFFVTEFLTPRSAVMDVPDDWIYVHNFANPDKPAAINLPAGQGRVYQASLKKAIHYLSREIPGRLEQDFHIKKRKKLIQDHSEVRENLLSRMESQASVSGFALQFDDRGGLSLSPLADGKAMSADEFEQLPLDHKQDIKSRSSKLMDSFLDTLQSLSREEAELEKKKRDIDVQETRMLLEESLKPIEVRFQEHTAIVSHLQDVSNDILENLEEFYPLEPESSSRESFTPDEDVLRRYDVNLFVDNSRTTGAPIIFDGNPSYFNLLGSIQRETEMGTMHTDFTLLKPGSLHQANGGFLILHVESILQHHSAWEGLLRCLASGRITLEDSGDSQEQFRTKTLMPQPIGLSVRLFLIGTDELFELLMDSDERFSKYFKLKAHMQEWMPRRTDTIELYLEHVAEIGRREKLLPLNRKALASLVDYSSRIIEDQEKLSLRFPHIREIMIEAHALCRMDHKDIISEDHVLLAIRNREYRASLYEEEFLYEYDRQAIKVPTTGEEVGQAIGLSVSQYGDYVMALPHLISCTVGVGHGGLLDLEREAELGGPIHTKGMMILKSYFMNLFAQNKPLTFTGSLCFEQSYAHVDGDSASGAELAALLSALANVPINLSLAFTGAVSQSGKILAVGEVSKKIEGFFAVCQRRGLTGYQGVLIPKDNVVHLMLREDVIEAVRKGIFAIYPVSSIEEAMEILTSIPAGRPLKHGSFSKGSLYERVDHRLFDLAHLAEKEIKKRRIRKKQ